MKKREIFCIIMSLVSVGIAVGLYLDKVNREKFEDYDFDFDAFDDEDDFAE